MADLILLVLSGGMSGAELAATLDVLKEKSKAASSHKRRQLYWDAYGQMIAATTKIDGPAFCFLTYRTAPEGEDGVVELVELTKRQRGLVGGQADFFGHKIKPHGPDGKPDLSAKTWAIAYSEESAAAAWEDLHEGEPVILINPDGIYVATRYKRVLCKSLSGLPKTAREAEALGAELAPEKPLRSVSFGGNAPPSVNAYNVVLAGASKFDKDLPAIIGAVGSTSHDEAYDCFLHRRNAHMVGEADKLVAAMLADVGKGMQPLVGTGQKACVVAYKNALMRRVYVHESMRKFIQRAAADGSVELHVIRGDVEPTSEFAKYGMLVFELFYRCDLEAFS